MKRAILLSCLSFIILMFANVIYAQQWTVNLNVYEDGVFKYMLVCGIHPDGTDSLDADLEEIEFPPKPPAGNFDVRFIGDSLKNGVQRDIRANTIEQKEFIIDIQRSSSNTEVTITWETLPSGSFVFQDIFGGETLNIDMDTTNSVTISNSAINRIKLLITPALLDTLPEASFTVTPDSGTTETEFIVNASASTDSHDVISNLQVRWDWESDSIWDTEYSAAKIDTHVYSIPGTYTIKLEVLNTGGLTDTTTMTVLVTEIPKENTHPKPSFSVTPLIGYTTTEYNVDASFSTDSEDPVDLLQVRWDWESDDVWDTDFTTIKTATHIFSSPGKYTIGLEVKDSGGLSATIMHTVMVNVKANAPVQIDIPSNTKTISLQYSNTSFSLKFESGAVEGKTVTVIAYGTVISDSVHTGPVFNNAVGYYNIQSSDITSFTGTLIFTYTDSLLNGILETDLRIAYFDETAGMWKALHTDVDTVNNQASASIDHLSLWALTDKNDDLITIVEGEQITGIPSTFELFQNYPNPFNPATTIKYCLTASSNVTLEIYNTLGQLVVILKNDFHSAGEYTIQWDGKNIFGTRVPSGVYLYRLRSGHFVQTRKMVLLR